MTALHLADLADPLTGPITLTELADSDTPIADDLTAQYSGRITWRPFNHQTFLDDHDHAAWVAYMEDLWTRLAVVNLDRPWSVDRIGENMPFKWVGCCDLCDWRTPTPKPKQASAEASVRSHSTSQHGWSPRRQEF